MNDRYIGIGPKKAISVDLYSKVYWSQKLVWYSWKFAISFPLYSPHSLCTGMPFPNCFLFLLILPDVDTMHFVTFFITCETSSIKNWFAPGLAENLTQMVFRQPFVIQHVRTRSLNCETWNFWCFYILINMNLICDLWCYCFPPAAFVLLRDLSHTNAWLNHNQPPATLGTLAWMHHNIYCSLPIIWHFAL